MRLSPIIAAGSCKKFTVWRGHQYQRRVIYREEGCMNLMTDIAMRYLSTMNALSTVKNTDDSGYSGRKIRNRMEMKKEEKRFGATQC
jgi:hypothetical protein